LSQSGILNNSIIPPGAGVDALIGNDAIVVGPNGANDIFTVGTGLLNVTGNAGTNTLTWNLVNGLNGQLIIGGGVAPIWGNLTSIGGTIVVTEGPNTLHIETGASVAIQFDEDAGSAVPALGIINVNSAVGTDVNDATYRNLRTSGAGNTISISLNNAISLPSTNAAGTAGIIYLNNSTFMHGYGSSNTFLGDTAGNLTITGANNAGIGTQVLTALTSGNFNSAAGSRALDSLTSGSDNSAVGYSALANITTENNNTAIGSFSLSSNTASDNSALGTNSLLLNTIGTRNTALGTFSGAANVIGNDITAVGYNSLVAATAGPNTAVGSFAGDAITTGTENVLMGYSAGGALVDGNKNIVIGDNALATNVSGETNIAIGWNALNASTNSSNVAVGARNLELCSSGGQNTAIGHNVLRSTTTANNNTCVGFNVMPTATASGNSALGSNALNACTTGDLNCAVGYAALTLLQDAQRCVAIGYLAATTDVSGSDLTAIGYRALRLATAGPNTAVGSYAGEAITSGTDNTLIGYQAGNAFTTGGYNSALGRLAGSGWTTSDSDNICIANTGTAGDNNTIKIGTNGTGAGQQNITYLYGGNILTPNTSAFSAYLGAADSNVTGAGAVFQLGSGNAFTEHYDIRGDFNTNGTFTAPVAAKYFFTVTLQIQGLTAAMTRLILNLVTSGGRTYRLYEVNPGAVKSSTNNISINGQTYAELAALETVVVDIAIYNGVGNTAGIGGTGATLALTWFQGHLAF